jgi:hypothetical protein
MTVRTISRPTRRRALVLAAPAAGAFLAVSMAAPAQAATDYNVTIPFAADMINPCNGEEVFVTGTEHDNDHITFDGSGGAHVDFHFNVAGASGTGSQGNTYQFLADFRSSAEVTVGQVFNGTLNEQMVSHGSAPNFVVQDHAHFTVHEDGTVSSEHSYFTSECRG